jgi:hypothetical protein
MEGRIQTVRTAITDGKLTIHAEIETDEGDTVHAVLPGREKAALVPRAIFVGEDSVADPTVLGPIQKIVEKSSLGRRVRTWEYREETYYAFLPWSGVTFSQREDGDANSA